jgi:hypothetical protein
MHGLCGISIRYAEVAVIADKMMNRRALNV